MGATFRTGDLFAEFRRQGHNRRTRCAWDFGVKARALHFEPLYDRAAGDFARAELAGWAAADARIKAGERWVCGECGTPHGDGGAP